MSGWKNKGSNRVNHGTESGDREIRAALAESWRLFASVGFFSIFVNILMLTGPLFMLQVYDRVLTSRSGATLLTLVIITAFLFLMMGVLDYARGRVMARAGARLQARLDDRVLRATLTRALSPAARAEPATGLGDLDAMQRFAAGNGPFAFFDAPWTPVFLCALFLFHWMLGVFALCSGLLLLLVALLNQTSTRKLRQDANIASAYSMHFVEQMRANSETVQGLGMQDAVIARSGKLRGNLLDQSLAAADRGGLFSVITRTLRLFLQSMMLGLGAWLAIQGQVTFGIIIAASILLGRALAPIDQAVGQWPLLQRALEARRSLARLLHETPPALPRTTLPAPRAIVEVQNLVVVAPGAKIPAVRGASFKIEPGKAVGIAGPSASGKSTLARALAGVWPTVAGSVRLDGAELEQYSDDRSRYIGYLPQEIVLFDGTVAQNIARMMADANDEDIVIAAKQAGAHEMILKLPGGYDFQVSAGGAALSGGQRQRIALARAFYGSPVLIVMDEPDSNLDAEGTMALARAVEHHKARGGAAVIVAHRHGAFAQCDIVYVMQNGHPVPAQAGRRKAPVRQLQQQPDAAKPAAAKPDAAAAAGAGQAPRLKVAGSEPPPVQADIPSRDRQIADAISRITNARFKGRRLEEDPPAAAAGQGSTEARNRLRQLPGDR